MYDPDAFRRTHDKILKAIGAEHIRFHDLRHTFATLSLKSGVDVKTLSGALGHYSAGFTPVSYTHLDVYKRQLLKVTTCCEIRRKRFIAPTSGS